MPPLNDLANLESTQGLVLYSHIEDYTSHCVRFLIAEKDIPAQIIFVDPAERPEDLAVLNPYNTLPTLVERELRLYHLPTMLNYLDERYRQPRLFSDGVVERAHERQYLWRIQQDWLSLADTILMHPDSLSAAQAVTARHQLTDQLIGLVPLFKHFPWFMREQFGMCDVLLAPLLWRLPMMNIHLPPAHCAPLLAYCQRLFNRPAFIRSLSPKERLLQRVALSE